MKNESLESQETYPAYWVSDKPIIFLDIDGVLNIFSASYKTLSYDNNHLHRDTVTRMEYCLVKRLEYLVGITNAYIVVSSAWDTESVKRVLTEHNFKYCDRVLGRTQFFHKDRGAEIMQYVKRFKIDRYVVLEDEIRDCVDYVPKQKLIEVDYRCGLSDKNVFDSIIVLTGEAPSNLIGRNNG